MFFEILKFTRIFFNKQLSKLKISKKSMSKNQANEKFFTIMILE